MANTRFARAPQIDLSDIYDFVELPDGKVISSSESGHLLLWEGNFVKTRFVTSDQKPDEMYTTTLTNDIFGTVPAHEGGIYVTFHDRLTDSIVTAGADGTVKWWDFKAIDVAEVDSDITMDYPLVPTRTINVGADVMIKSIVPSPDDNSYIIVDGNGKLLKLPLDSETPETLWTFHAGPIVGIAASPIDHYAVTAGVDGNVSVWDYVSKEISSTAANG